MKYPYIGRGKVIYENKRSGVEVLFYARDTGVVVGGCDYNEVGEFYDIWNESHFENITREYLDNTYGEVEGQEHARFIIKLAEGAGFDCVGGESIKDARSFVFYSDGILIFYGLMDCELAKNKKSRKIALPLPPKEDDMKREDVKIEDWPRVGDEVALRYRFDSKSIHITGKLEFISHRNLIVDDCHKIRSEYDIEKPPTPEEELKERLTKTTDNYRNQDLSIQEVIAKAIINGEIEGLQYK